jgi:site-specific recombinase XerD
MTSAVPEPRSLSLSGGVLVSGQLLCRNDHLTRHALFGRIGERAKMPFPVHTHMLRHGCGYALANAGHDTRALQAWLGHKKIQHTVRYTELAPDRFKNFWR